ncbi:GNAT family N-acetyltransferase [Myxococcaceae bacterium GXIMD 01537]
MTDAELSARMRENLVAFRYRLRARSSLRHLALPGVHAFALPDQPKALRRQHVLYESAPALDRALETLSAFFRDLGIGAWRVSVPTGDTEAARLLALAGLRAEDTQTAMGCLLEGPTVAPPTLALEEPEELEELLALNAEAFGEPAGVLQMWREPPRERLFPLLVREGGRLLAGGLAHDEGDTTGIYLVATSEAARRRGLASEVMRGLMSAAHTRGRVAAVLQTTTQGHGVYRRLGFRDVDTWTNWVHRASAPAP